MRYPPLSSPTIALTFDSAGAYAAPLYGKLLLVLKWSRFCRYPEYYQNVNVKTMICMITPRRLAQETNYSRCSGGQDEEETRESESLKNRRENDTITTMINAASYY